MLDWSPIENQCREQKMRVVARTLPNLKNLEHAVKESIKRSSQFIKLGFIDFIVPKGQFV